MVNTQLTDYRQQGMGGQGQGGEVTEEIDHKINDGVDGKKKC